MSTKATAKDFLSTFVLEGYVHLFSGRIHFKDPSFSKLLVYARHYGVSTCDIGGLKKVEGVRLHYFDQQGIKRELIHTFHLAPEKDTVNNLSLGL